MPLIAFVCNNPECQNRVEKFFRPSKMKEIPPFLDCGECGTGKLEKTMCGPSSASKFTIDNGVQAKAVEVINNIWEMNLEASKKGKE